MVRLIERILREDIDAVRKQFSSIPEEDFDIIIRIDPTFNENRNSVGKYGKWLLTLCLNDTNRRNIIKYAESEREDLARYDSLKNDRRYNIERDIMRFKNFQQLLDAIDTVETAELSQRQKQKQAKKDKPYNMVFDGDKYAVFVPKNHDGDMILASFGGSSKATWCTAADSENGVWRYDYYLEKGGKYYVIINKNNYEEKYQFHFESDQFKDRNNDSISLDGFLEDNPDIRWFFESEGYNREKRNINEIVSAVGVTGSIAGLWNKIKDDRFDIIDDFFGAIANESEEVMPDAYYEALEEILPEFSKSVTPEQKKEIMFYVFRKTLGDVKSSIVNCVTDALMQVADDTQKWSISCRWVDYDYAVSYDGWVNEQMLKFDVEEFVNDYGGECDTWDFVNFYKDKIADYCFDGETPTVLQYAGDFETYFCNQIFEPAYRNLNLYPMHFVKSLYENQYNVEQSKINALVYAREHNIDSIFTGVDEEEMLKKNSWTVYTINATREEFEEYTGKDFYNTPMSEAWRDLLYAMPVEDMKQEVVHTVGWLPSCNVAIKNDGTDYKYSNENWSDFDIEKKFGVHRATANESYNKNRITMREK